MKYVDHFIFINLYACVIYMQIDKLCKEYAIQFRVTFYILKAEKYRNTQK